MYIKGKIKCYDILNKKIVFLDKNEFNNKSENIVRSSKYQMIAKDNNGENITVFNDDIRLSNGELFSANAKHFYQCNIHGKQLIKNHQRLKRAKIPEKYKIYCPKCANFYLSDSFLPEADDIKKCVEALNDIAFIASNQQTPKYFSKYMPQFYKIIHEFKIDDISIRFSDKIYFLKNSINNIPKCQLDDCDNKTDLLKSTSSFGFTKYCDIHKNYNFSSDGQLEIVKFIREHFTGEVLENYRGISNKEIDIYLPYLKLGIEYNGLYWHSEIFKNKIFHSEKKDFFKSKNIDLIYIWEDDWKTKKSIIESIILNRLQLSERIYARNCKMQVIDNNVKSNFLNNNHIQGDCSSKINIGLFYNEMLISVMCFGKKRRILGQTDKMNNEYELLRFANKIGNNVTGGASKLFKNFIYNYAPEKIISYANMDLFNGGLYEKLGFKFINRTGPNYWWFKSTSKYHRSNFMKHNLVKKGADPTKTEVEIMHDMGYYRIWGSGNLKYEWTKNP